MNTCCSTPLGWATTLFLALIWAPCLSAGQPGNRPAPLKTDVASARLLLPLYLVDTTDPAGVTTLFAIRNQLDVQVEVEVRYFQVDAPQAPQRTDSVTLAAKAVAPVNIRLVPGLSADADGIARGYVVAEATTAGAVIQGDYFRVTAGEDFASGFRMLNIDPGSSHNDLCGLFSIRFLNGGGFDSGTRFIIWLEADQAPVPATPVFAYSAYDESGVLVLSSTYFADDVAFEVEAADLFVGPLQAEFGAIEFQFVDTVGHVAAILSASGRYSVGLEAFCGDF
ncbi:MAG: hypothetical protein V3T72_13100 [Thermoanaerobaculia bacterium]